MSAHDFTTRIGQFIAKCPGAISGQGGHNRTFSVACALYHGFALSESETLNFLQQWNSKCDPQWTEAELLHKVRGAVNAMESNPRGYLLNGERQHLKLSPVVVKREPPKWPPLDEGLVKLVARTRGGIAELWEASSVVPSDSPDPERMLDTLFPGNPLLCLGMASDRFATKPRSDWRGHSASHQFIVPSPMSAPTGSTKEGKLSAHCLDNTGPRRFLVVEFDHHEAGLQASILLHLSKYMPFVCAVHSGSKSVHGWFYCRGWDDLKVWKFFRYAVSLGADRATWTRSQFVRLPDGTRDNGNRQNVYYLNPAPLEGV